MHDTFVGHGACDAAVILDQPFHSRMRDDLGAETLRPRQQCPRRGQGLGRALFRHMQRQFRNELEIGLDRQNFGAAHPADAITPG